LQKAPPPPPRKLTTLEENIIKDHDDRILRQLKMELRTITRTLVKRRVFKEFVLPIVLPIVLPPEPPRRALSPVIEQGASGVEMGDDIVQETIVFEEEEIPIVEYEPMDLSKIAVNINNSVYCSPQDWVDDIDKILKVPHFFNIDRTLLHCMTVNRQLLTALWNYATLR
jgi:hypothetical protein